MTTTSTTPPPALPSPITYAARPERMTTTATGVIRTAQAGEVAHDFNLTDDFLQNALQPFLNNVRETLGVRIWNGSTWVQAQLYLSAEDPASLPAPPVEPYVWLQIPGGVAA